jgi:hypothetical protein
MEEEKISIRVVRGEDSGFRYIEEKEIPEDEVVAAVKCLKQYCKIQCTTWLECAKVCKIAKMFRAKYCPFNPWGWVGDLPCAAGSPITWPDISSEQ